MNHYVYATATVPTKTTNEPGKTMKNIRNKDSWKTETQKQTSNCRKEMSTLAESGTSSDNIKLHIKKIIFSHI
jgi:hypothetical protein